MAWPFSGQSDDVISDDESSRERIIEMGGVSIEEVPLPDAGDLSEEEAWTISPGPARARLGSTDVAAIVSKALPSVGGGSQQPVQATVDTSGIERLVSTRLDTVEDTVRGVESRLLETIPAILAATGMLNEQQAAAIASGDDDVLSAVVDAGEDEIAETGDTIITADGEVITVGDEIDNDRLMGEDEASLLELYEAQALSVNPFLASLEGLSNVGDGAQIGAHTVSALLLDHLTGMASSSFVNKAKSSGLLTEKEANQVLSIVQLAAPGEPDDALKDHLPDRELLTLSTLVTAWRNSVAPSSQEG